MYIALRAWERGGVPKISRGWNVEDVSKINEETISQLI